MIEWEVLAGLSALIAAAATVLGMIALLLFFSRGQPWGTINDVFSVVLMLAMIPVALGLFALGSEPPLGMLAWAVALLGIAGMLVAAGLQAALVVGRLTFEQVNRNVLAAGALVGLWYMLAGALAFRVIGTPLGALAVISGIGFIAVGYGFAVGGERHPLSIVGGLALFVASTAFLTWIGLRLLSGDLVVPNWNA